ncbi:hypothetical protein M493_02127 [Geobacillus genomosp. 3]|uniref:Uncharacterized protein n=1 Tax=Geobacillus genomosp. 3 TaxID=1921421 RepID=V5LVP0_GEOG3|nr:hypothetical protein M493_02127 [Geobacillus genomosp. 3]
MLFFLPYYSTLIEKIVLIYYINHYNTKWVSFQFPALFDLMIVFEYSKMLKKEHHGSYRPMMLPNDAADGDLTDTQEQ